MSSHGTYSAVAMAVVIAEPVLTTVAPASSISTYKRVSDVSTDDGDNESTSTAMPFDDDKEAQKTPVKEWEPTTHEKMVIYTLALTSLIVALDATIIITPLSTIIQDLKGTATQAFWIGTSYLLANAVTMPVVCALSDVLGRPICLIFSLVAFTVGTILCAVAQNVGTMLIGRSIQGVGGAGIHSLGLFIQTDIVPLRWRPKWYGVTLGFWALGLAIGPIIGGAVVHSTTWRWIFYLMFPILGFSLIAIPFLLTMKPRETTFVEKLTQIDWLGSFLFTGSATSFLIALSWGGSQFEWNSIQTLVPLIIGFVGLLATLLYERFGATQAFLRHSLYHNVSSTVTYICGCIQGMIMYGVLYYGPFYFLSVKGFSPLNTGISMLPATLTVTGSGIVTGCLVTRYNNYRWSIVIGWVIASIGAGLLLIWPHNDSAGVWVTTYLLIGLGQGAILNAQNFASQALCKPGDEAAAAAMYAFVRQFGMALGVGIGGTTFQNIMAIKLRSFGYSVEIARQAESYISVLQQLPAEEFLFKENVLASYRYGFGGLFTFYFSISLLGLLLSLFFVENVDMTRNLDSDHQLDGSRWEKK